MEKPWNTINDPPDWKDSGPVEVKRPDGTVLTGSLEADDVVFDGESSWPIHYVHFEDGTRQIIHEFDFWRLLK